MEGPDAGTKRLEQRLRKLRGSSLSERNKELSLGFLDYMQLANASIKRSTVAVHAENLLLLGPFFEVDFDRAKLKDIQKVVRRMQEAGWSPFTYAGVSLTLKQLIKWVRTGRLEKGSYPPEVSWLTVRFPTSPITAEKLLGPEEIKRMVEAATSLRDKALILVHYEGGFRIGETLSLKVGSVAFDEKGALLTVVGKTGMRRVRVIYSTSLLAQLLDEHPTKRPEDPLFIARARAGFVGLQYCGACRAFKRAAHSAGVSKNVRTHIFRHSRATELASFFSDAQARAHFGWSPGSDMPSRYVHLAGVSTDDALLRSQGQKVEMARPALYTLQCGRCREPLSPGVQFCHKCGQPIDQAKWLARDEKVQEGTELMNRLMEDPDFQRVIMRKLSTLLAGQPVPSPSITAK